MKKRVILLAACLFMLGCGKPAENASMAPSTNEATTIEAVDSVDDSNSDENTAAVTEISSTETTETASYDSSVKDTEPNDDSTSIESNTADSDNAVDNDSASESSVATNDTTSAEDTNTPNDSSSAESQNAANDSASTESSSAANETIAEEPAPQQDNVGYGRIFFVGDSRTVDMFDGNTSEIYDYNANNIRVFAKDGCHCAYLTDVIGNYGIDSFDTLVSWLGCNDNNDAALYEQVYENLLNQGKTVVICTVGPTADEYLSGDFDTANYPNEKMVAFNQNITAWASAHGVKVIDLYSYVQGNIEISQDGIHYNPKPTTAIWNYILGCLQ